MGPKLIMMAFKFLSSPEGRHIAKSIVSGSKGASDILLKGLGAKNPTQGDYDDLKNIAENLDIDNSDTMARLHDVIIGTPEEYVAKTAAAAAQGILNYSGQKAVNKSNALAAALLEGNRQQTAQQEAIYGLNDIDKANKTLAAKTGMTGANKKALTDNVSKVIGKVFGDYERQNDMYKANELLQTINNNGNKVPSTAFNWLNGIRGSSDRNRGNI